MRPRRISSYRISYSNPLTDDPSRAHTMQSIVVEIGAGDMKLAPLGDEHLLNS